LKIKNNVIRFDSTCDFFVEQGAKCINDGNYIKGLNNLYCALRKKSSSVPAMIHLAIAYQKMGLFDASNSALYKILASHPDNEGAFALLGQNYSLLGDHLRELFYLKNFSEMTDDSELMEIFEKPSVFFPKYEQVYPISKDMREALINRGIKLLQGGHLSQARDCFFEVVDSFPDDAFAKNHICQILIVEEKFAQAIDLAKQIVLKDKKNVFGWCNLAMALHMVGNHQQRDDAIYQALLVDSCDEDDDKRLVKILCLTNKFRASLKYTDKILKKNPYDIDYLTFAAVASYNCGEYEKSKEYFLTINSIFPDTEVVRYHLSVVQKAIDGQVQTQILPFDMVLPEHEEKRVIVEIENMDFSLVWKNEEYERYISWAFNNENLALTQFILDKLYLANPKKTKRILKNLLAQEYGWQFKSLVLWKYLQHYPKKNIYANKDGYFVPLEMPKNKLPKNDEMPFWKAFAVLSTLFVPDDQWLDKLQYSANQIDERYQVAKQNNLSIDEVAALIVREAKLQGFDDGQICVMFRVPYNRLAQVTELLLG